MRPSGSLMTPPPKDMTWQAFERSFAFKVLIITVYLASNISLNMLNKVCMHAPRTALHGRMGLAHAAGACTGCRTRRC